jgi:hypothetical protein
VDGDEAGADVLEEIAVRMDKPSARAPHTAAYAARERIDKILVVVPVNWGYQREAGFVVDLRGRLYDTGEKPKLLWEGRSRSKRESGKEARDVSEPRRRLLESAARSVNALVAALVGI